MFIYLIMTFTWKHIYSTSTRGFHNPTRCFKYQKFWHGKNSCDVLNVSWKAISVLNVMALLNARIVAVTIWLSASWKWFIFGNWFINMWSVVIIRLLMAGPWWFIWTWPLSEHFRKSFLLSFERVARRKFEKANWKYFRNSVEMN